MSAGKGGGEYVEILYTLHQDLTLFILFRNRNIDIWKRKLEWIVSKVGMAMKLIYPGDVSPNGSTQKKEEYPIHNYREFPEYAMCKYEGHYYLPLPMEKPCCGRPIT